MGSMRKLAALIVVCILLESLESAKIDPKLDFEDRTETFQVKKQIQGGKIKGLRVTVDTSELKGLKDFFLGDCSVATRVLKAFWNSFGSRP